MNPKRIHNQSKPIADIIENMLICYLRIKLSSLRIECYVQASNEERACQKCLLSKHSRSSEIHDETVEYINSYSTHHIILIV